MLKEHFEGKRVMKTIHQQTAVDGKSLKQTAIAAQQEFSNAMSPALKRMKQAYFEQVAEECYPDKWLSPSSTN